MKKRKQYKPKPIKIDAVYTTVNLVKPVQEDSIETLLSHVTVAITAFTNGVADKSHFDVLASMVDMCMMADNTLFKKAYADDIQDARKGLIRCRERYIKTERLGLDGEALTAIRTCAYIYEQQLNNLTGAEVMGFLKARHYHISSGNYFRVSVIRG